MAFLPSELRKPGRPSDLQRDWDLEDTPCTPPGKTAWTCAGRVFLISSLLCQREKGLYHFLREGACKYLPVLNCFLHIHSLLVSAGAEAFRKPRLHQVFLINGRLSLPVTQRLPIS